MSRLDRQLIRWRVVDPTIVDGAIALLFSAFGLLTVFGQGIRDADGALIDDFREPTALAIVTILLTCLPIAARRRTPLLALAVSAPAILLHFLARWPQGFLPVAVLLLTYTVGAACATRRAFLGLGIVVITIVTLGIADPPGLDRFGAIGVLTQYCAAWAIGVAMRSRRLATDARVSQAEDRAEAERQSTARALAEERLRIAQELHDVVAHSMSVIAVQAGVGVHVLDQRPEQARSVLETISATSRGTLTEMRRLLGVLRDADGLRAHLPAPGLADLPRLIEDVRAAGVPVTLSVIDADGSADDDSDDEVDGSADDSDDSGDDVDGFTERAGAVPAGVGMSAYRVVQEALTNVIKHAGTPTRVDVNVRHAPGSVTVEVVDDGRGLAAIAGRSGTTPSLDGTGHGIVGMRERVQVWGGELTVGPTPGGGYRVAARLPYGDGG